MSQSTQPQEPGTVAPKAWGAGAVGVGATSKRRSSGRAAATRPTVRDMATEREAARVAGDLELVNEAGTVIHASNPAVTESIRYMLGRLRLTDGIDLPERVGVTSTVSGEGVSYIAQSLALVLTNDAGRRVCLVDLNWADPTEWPGHEGTGIADVIRGDVSVEEAFYPTGNEGLTVIPAGFAAVMERPALAQSPELDKILVGLSETFDHIILDLPAIQSSSEALALAERSRTVALVVNQGVTPDDQVKLALNELGGVPVLGVILNRTTTKVPRLLRRLIPGA